MGAMQGTGYQDQQWLIDRDGRFLQVTELLYRVAEQADGSRALEDIAARVTATTDWSVSADNVRQLIEQKLVPLGVIAAPGDPRSAQDRASRAGKGRSPLELGMRARVLGPRIIAPIAKFLRHLHAPPLVVPVIAGAVAAHIWLFSHGIGGAVTDVVLRPRLLLVVLVLVVASAVFHEFGHASALTYGGGRARGMGVGMYLIYPVFYTDVTDCYRLGRRARVRVDLGGIYFHLIFAVAVIALSLVTGQEWLLLAAVLIDLEILRQFTPVVRLDGYWLLADLTGVPDFFSHMGPFLRSVLPVRRWRRGRLPALTPLVNVAFATYIAVTIPVLALLSVVMVRHMPGIVATVVHSFEAQSTAFSAAATDGKIAEAALRFTEMAILALPLMGVANLIYALGRLASTAARTGGPALRRRIGTRSTRRARRAGNARSQGVGYDEALRARGRAPT